MKIEKGSDLVGMLLFKFYLLVLTLIIIKNLPRIYMKKLK
jgi:hypothetical protein